MKRKLMLIGGGGLIFASSFPMIATSCGVKKKDVETSKTIKKINEFKTQLRIIILQIKSRFQRNSNQSMNQNKSRNKKIQKPNSCNQVILQY